MSTPFIDTNIFLRHLLQDHADHSVRATKFLQRIEDGELKAYTADTVIFEAVFTLQRFYLQPGAAIRAALLPLIELPGIILPGKRRYRQVFEYYVELSLPFADAYHAVLAQSLNANPIISFDRDFDRLPDVIRQEPQ
jgi:predicted nucleic acid-binding protein